MGSDQEQFSGVTREFLSDAILLCFIRFREEMARTMAGIGYNRRGDRQEGGPYPSEMRQK